MPEANGTPLPDPNKVQQQVEHLDRELAQVELADIVRLKKPYMPAFGMSDKQKGPFGFGIVAEILTVLPDGRTRNVSCYLYDPVRREIFMGPNNIPEYVDFHTSELVLFKRATDQGYTSLPQ
jgi:hypothetical protein